MSNLESPESVEPVQELTRRVSRFRHETRGLDADDNIENNLAILRHARAIVEEQIDSSPKDESTSRLIHLKEKLSRQIRALEAEEPHAEQSGESGRAEAVGIAAALVGASLIALAVFLAAKDRRLSP